MLTLEAPYPGIQTTSFLPNPQLGDSEELTDEVVTKRAMDGTLYTYVKTKNQRRRLVFSLVLSRMKALELRGFITAYYASTIRFTDHLDRVWVGNLVNDPFEFSTPNRSGNCPGQERQTIQLEFEGILQ